MLFTGALPLTKEAKSKRLQNQKWKENSVSGLAYHSIWQTGAVMLNLHVQYAHGRWSGRKKDVNEYLLPKKKNSELKFAPVSCCNILLTCDKPTASDLFRKSCIKENGCSSVSRPLVRPEVPWGPLCKRTQFSRTKKRCKYHLI